MKRTFTKISIVVFLSIANLSSFSQSPFIGLFLEEIPNTTANFTSGEKTYRLYAELSSGLINQMFGDETRPHLIQTSTTFYQDNVYGSNTQDGINPAFFMFVPSLEFDSWTTLGDSYTSGPSTVGNLNWPSFAGSSWSFGGTPNSDASIFRVGTDPLCLPDANGMVLLGQFTTTGVLSGYINLKGQYTIGGLAWEENNIPIPQLQIMGCTDPLACNYDATATVDDGSCVYATTSSSTATACDSYTWNGTVYTSTGSYT